MSRAGLRRTGRLHKQAMEYSLMHIHYTPEVLFVSLFQYFSLFLAFILYVLLYSWAAGKCLSLTSSFLFHLGHIQQRNFLIWYHSLFFTIFLPRVTNHMKKEVRKKKNCNTKCGELFFHKNSLGLGCIKIDSV